MNVVSGATLKIYTTQTEIINNISPKHTATTDKSGTVNIQAEFKNQYFFTIKKEIPEILLMAY